MTLFEAIFLISLVQVIGALTIFGLYIKLGVDKTQAFQLALMFYIVNVTSFWMFKGIS